MSNTYKDEYLSAVPPVGFIERIDGTLALTDNFVARFDSFVDLLIGSAPDAATKTGERPESGCGVLGGLFRRTERTLQRVAEGHEALDRLERYLQAELADVTEDRRHG